MIDSPFDDEQPSRADQLFAAINETQTEVSPKFHRQLDEALYTLSESSILEIDLQQLILAYNLVNFVIQGRFSREQYGL